jgi:hypothetical protein
MPQTSGHFDETNLMVGSEVYTRDGDKLGQVKEVRAGAFKIDASMQPDYWLSTGHIDSYTTERVVLAFDKDNLGDFKYDNPEDVAAGRTGTYTTDPTGTTARRMDDRLR